MELLISGGPEVRKLRSTLRMPGDSDISDRVSQLLATINADDAKTVLRNPRSTVEPPQEVKSGQRALEVLQGLTHDHRAYIEEAVLGQGGMGVVKLARQVSLDRPVAVKMLKPTSSVHEAEALLAEAWLAGSLEHPGILPIYALSLGADGKPFVVMKRIEGVTWGKLLAGEADLETYAPGRTRLESHLRIAMQLCNAVHFANSRGVVHRDLKPDNVMLGRFGEVYLVDWGIATAAGPTTQFAGTPAYMAPEMVGGAGAQLSGRTDVYLLGAILHEVVTGKPPHVRPSTPEMFESVLRSTPMLPANVPGELAELIRRCMARAPEARPGSALEVRQALEQFLEHQGSRELVEQSEARAAEFSRLVSDAAPDAVQVGRLFSECRFGLQQALRVWADNPEARRALARITMEMIRFELAHGSVRAAQTLLADLDAPPKELLDAVSAAQNAELDRARELERLHRLAESLDPLTGSVMRMVTAAMLGVIWASAPIVGLFFYRANPQYDETLGAVPISLLSLLTLFVMVRRTPLSRRTPLNEKIAHLLSFALVVQAAGLLYLRFGLGGIGGHVVPVLLVYWGLISGAVASVLVKEVWPTSVGFGLMAIASVQWPEWRYVLGAFANVGLIINLFVMFLSQQRQLEARAAAARAAPPGP
jgi:hypothetical protein